MTLPPTLTPATGTARATIERRYISAALTPGIGGATLKGLLIQYGNIDHLWEAASRADASGALKRIKGHGATGQAKAEEIRIRTARAGATICVWEDPTYPASLRSASNPPPVLYVRGDVQRLTLRALALVGTTDPDPPFARVAATLARQCADYGIHVVSGLARGIDATALRAAAEAGVPSFAVVGHGIDFEYPASSRPIYAAVAHTGAVISQFPTGQPPQRWTFPMRNEVMCTLAYGTVIVQAHKKDGSLIQADFSFKHGRDVFVYERNAELQESEWVGDLQARGARLFSSFDEILGVVSERHEQFRELAAQPFEARDQLLMFNHPEEEPEATPLPAAARTGGPTILMDIDGVVADTQALTESVAEAALRDLTGRDVARGSLRGKSPFQIARHGGVDWERFKARYNPALETVLKDASVINVEVVDCIREARRAGWKVVAVTSQPRRRTMLVLKETAAEFDEIITWNDTPRAAKPAPDSLLLGLRRVGGQVDQALMVGDTHSDLQAARAARVRSVAVLWGYESADELARYSPDHVVATPAELSHLIRNVRFGDEHRR